MDISLIETMVRQSCSDDHAASDLCDLLAVVAERQNIEPDDRELERGTRFVVGYVEQVPYMLKVAQTAGTTVGIEAAMDRIIEAVVSYWLQGEDIIPDHLGIIGLLDDAYCSLTTLQAVSDHYQLQTGKHLFPDDLTVANRVMRKIIGEPYASDLDRFVNQALQEAGVMSAVKALASQAKQKNFDTNANIWNHGPAGQMPVDELRGLGLTETE